MNKYVIKALVFCVLCISGILAFAPVTTYAQSPGISINGERIEIPSNVEPPVIINGRALVPMYPVFERLGFITTWHEKLEAAMLSRPENSILIMVGEYGTTSTRGSSVVTDISPQVINGQLMIPIRMVIDATDLSVRWNGDNYTIEITGIIPVRDSSPTMPRYIDGFYLGMSAEDVESILTQRGINFRRVPLSAWCDGFFFVPENELARFTFDDFGALQTVSNSSDPHSISERGIRIGDSKERVIELYGNNYRLSLSSFITLEYTDGETYLFFSLTDGVVDGWRICHMSLFERFFDGN